MRVGVYLLVVVRGSCQSDLYHSVSKVCCLSNKAEKAIPLCKVTYRSLFIHPIFIPISQRPNHSGPGVRRPPRTYVADTELPLGVGGRCWLVWCVPVASRTGRLPLTVRAAHRRPGDVHFSEDHSYIPYLSPVIV